MDQPSRGSEKIQRRAFIKGAGAVSALLGGAGLGFFGYAAGRDPRSHTGWATHEGANQTFDREKWSVNHPHYEVTGPTSRSDARTEMIFQRRPSFRRQWRDREDVEKLDEPLRSFYKKHPDILALDLHFMKEVRPRQQEDEKKYGGRFSLARAWSHAMGAVSPDPVRDPRFQNTKEELNGHLE